GWQRKAISPALIFPPTTHCTSVLEYSKVFCLKRYRIHPLFLAFLHNLLKETSPFLLDIQ
ncbi:MAG TPA: hypothetical protein VFN35_24395, partial [Ktedonobacteraceae bacterium]|nr:hypothetical protein [Ktedonobacteraceae bacterium]